MLRLARVIVASMFLSVSSQAEQTGEQKLNALMQDASSANKKMQTILENIQKDNEFSLQQFENLEDEEQTIVRSLKDAHDELLRAAKSKSKDVGVLATSFEREAEKISESYKNVAKVFFEVEFKIKMGEIKMADKDLGGLSGEEKKAFRGFLFNKNSQVKSNDVFSEKSNLLGKAMLDKMNPKHVSGHLGLLALLFTPSEAKALYAGACVVACAGVVPSDGATYLPCAACVLTAEANYQTALEAYSKATDQCAKKYPGKLKKFFRRACRTLATVAFAAAAA